MSSRPGPWLRLTALGAAAATHVAVVSGTFGPGAAHSLLSALALPPLVALVIAAWVVHRRLLAPALAALVLFGLCALVTLPGVHVSLAALSFRGHPHSVRPVLPRRARPSGPWRDYVTLTKPRIMSLLLLTGAAGMFVGAQGVPDGWLFVAAMTGLACGGASALNHVLDADIDRLMGKRTESDLLPRVASRRHGGSSSGSPSRRSPSCCSRAANVLTAALALVGNLFYVLVYTQWLKRSTPQNIVIGGAAGAVPPLVGYAAATGNLEAAGAVALPDRLPLDASALLGARAADPARVQETGSKVPTAAVVRGERATTAARSWRTRASCWP